MGFRFEIGFDYFSYERIFDSIAMDGFWGFYASGKMIEPGYVFLLYLINLIYGDFSGVFVCSSFIGLFLFYRSFAFETDHCHMALCVFVFATTQYFYYFGIDRLFLSVSFVVYGFHFILSGKPRKYYAMVLLGACFHISALFMLVFPFLHLKLDQRLVGKNENIWNRSVVELVRNIIFLCSLPLLFYAIVFITPYLHARYSNYGEGVAFWTAIKSVSLKVPVVFLVLLTMKKTISYYSDYRFYARLYILSLFIQLCSSIAAVGRLNWFFWSSLCFLFPMMVRSFPKMYEKIAILMVVIMFCTGYCWYAYLNPAGDRYFLMFPYKNLFFEF